MASRTKYEIKQQILALIDKMYELGLEDAAPMSEEQSACQEGTFFGALPRGIARDRILTAYKKLYPQAATIKTLLDEKLVAGVSPTSAYRHAYALAEAGELAAIGSAWVYQKVTVRGKEKTDG
jgi:hypothetical protein